MVPPRSPSFCVSHRSLALGLPAGKAGLRPRRARMHENGHCPEAPSLRDMGSPTSARRRRVPALPLPAPDGEFAQPSSEKRDADPVKGGGLERTETVAPRGVREFP
jgi:hypothetical protein